jgi:hypothetical protein|tara:strand:+ start:63 stop:206 length:144 start_codon:yes stop_codon:yes gene_type:complete
LVKLSIETLAKSHSNPRDLEISVVVDNGEVLETHKNILDETSFLKIN